MSRNPLISIITVNLNNGEGLDRTLSSIWCRQSFDSAMVEHVVIDGGSTDQSLQVIDRYRDKLSYVVSEPDKGVYNAMNKGIKVAVGEYLVFMNSGDYFADNVLSSEFFNACNADIIYCNIYKVGRKRTTKYYLPAHISFDFLVHTTIPHQSTIIRRALLTENGYNESLRIVADWEFLVDKIITDKCSTQYLPIFLSFYDESGMSSDYSNHELMQTERRSVLDRLCRAHGELFVDSCQLHVAAAYNIFKSHNDSVMHSLRLQRKLRRWIKPLFLSGKIFNGKDE